MSDDWDDFASDLDLTPDAAKENLDMPEDTEDDSEELDEPGSDLETDQDMAPASTPESSDQPKKKRKRKRKKKKSTTVPLIEESVKPKDILAETSKLNPVPTPETATTPEVSTIVELDSAPELMDDDEMTTEGGYQSAIDEDFEAESNYPVEKRKVMSWTELISTLYKP